MKDRLQEDLIAAVKEANSTITTPTVIEWQKRGISNIADLADVLYQDGNKPAKEHFFTLLKINSSQLQDLNKHFVGMYLAIRRWEFFLFFGCSIYSFSFVFVSIPCGLFLCVCRLCILCWLFSFVSFHLPYTSFTHSCSLDLSFLFFSPSPLPLPCFQRTEKRF